MAVCTPPAACRGRRGCRAAPRSPCAPEALELRLHGGHQPVVVQRRRAQLAGEVEQLVHRLVHEPLQLGHLGRALGRRLVGERLQPQQDRGERLVDLVVEVARQAAALLLLGAHGQLARAAALLLDALEQAVEGARQPVDLLDGVGAAQLERRRLGGSIDSISSIRRSSGRKRRWSIHRFVHSVSTIASAMIMNSQRSLVEPRSSPAATLAASSVSANSTTLAATIWPMRESSRRVIRGLSIDRNAPIRRNGVSTPYRHAATGPKLLVRLRSAGVLPRSFRRKTRSGSSPGRSSSAPAIFFVK